MKCNFNYVRIISNIALLAVPFVVILSFASCGGSSSTSQRAPDAIQADTTETRTAVGSASGDISRVANLTAQRTSDGTEYQATINQTGRINALSGNNFSFFVDIPIGFSYNFNFRNGAGQTIAQIAVSNTQGGTTTNVPVNQGTTDINFGNIDFPEGSGESYENDDLDDDESFEIEGDHDPVESGETGEEESESSGNDGSDDSGGDSGSDDGSGNNGSGSDDGSGNNGSGSDDGGGSSDD